MKYIYINVIIQLIKKYLCIFVSINYNINSRDITLLAYNSH